MSYKFKQANEIQVKSMFSILDIAWAGVGSILAPTWIDMEVSIFREA
jgi:hypothetical protein